MAKSKSLASVVVSSIFVIYLVDDAHFLNDSCVAGDTVTVISPLTEM